MKILRYLILVVVFANSYVSAQDAVMSPTEALPRGSYQGTCGGCTVKDDRLTCYCDTKMVSERGKRIYFKAELPMDPKKGNYDIANRHGELRYESKSWLPF